MISLENLYILIYPTQFPNFFQLEAVCVCVCVYMCTCLFVAVYNHCVTDTCDLFQLPNVRTTVIYFAQFFLHKNAHINLIFGILFAVL